MTEDQKFDLLRKVDGKLKWIIFFLVLITLNTCSLDDNLSDAVRDMRRAQDEPAAPAAAPAPAPVSTPAPQG